MRLRNEQQQQITQEGGADHVAKTLQLLFSPGIDGDIFFVRVCVHAIGIYWIGIHTSLFAHPGNANNSTAQHKLAPCAYIFIVNVFCVFKPCVLSVFIVRSTLLLSLLCEMKKMRNKPTEFTTSHLYEAHEEEHSTSYRQQQPHN